MGKTILEKMQAEIVRRGLVNPLHRWHPYIPFQPTPKQCEVIGCPAKFILSGGGAGGAKSTGVLMRALIRSFEEPRLTWIVRRHLKDLRSTNGLYFLAEEWLKGTPAEHNRGDAMFRFPNGAAIQFIAYDSARDWEKIQGNAPHDIILEEMTQFEPEIVEKFTTRMRKTSKVSYPTSMVGTANPGGRAHDYCRERFVDEATRPEGHVYIHSTYLDNPHLDHEDYRQNFEAIRDPVLRAQQECGDWSVKSSGKYAHPGQFQYIDAIDVPALLWHATGYDIGLTKTGDDWAQVKLTSWQNKWYILSVSWRQMDEPIGREWILQGMRTSIAPHLHAFENQAYTLPTVQNIAQNELVDMVPWDDKEQWNRLAIYEEVAQQGGNKQRIKVTKVPITGDKRDKLSKAYALFDALERRQLYCVKGDWNKRFEDEVVFFTNSDGDKDNAIDAFGNGSRALIQVLGNQRLRAVERLPVPGSAEYYRQLAELNNL